jgi:L-lactate dehydrogenase complex protein LldG
VSAREDILGRIGRALADRPPAPQIPRSYRPAGARPGADLVALFSQRVSDYRATVRPCAPSAVAATVAKVLSEAGIARVVAPAGFPPDWCPGAVGDEPALTTRQLDQLDGVVTLCTVGIAQTGTLVLDHTAPGQGRRALTLLPDFHLVVIRSDQIVETVPDAIAMLVPTATMTWISGPSATSDIELTRVEGVHGPRRLEVLVVGGSG